jgi:hypothetical protein
MVEITAHFQHLACNLLAGSLNLVQPQPNELKLYDSMANFSPPVSFAML